MKCDRIIGQRTGKEKGPLLIVFGQMHGNEPAGTKAIHTLFQLMDREPDRNPDFAFKGKIVGILGNCRAVAQGKRFVQRDLNRMWTVENVRKVQSTPLHQLEDEELELREISDLIDELIADYQPERLVFLDIHTTTADGGIFVLPGEDDAAHEIALHLHAPVIDGMLDKLTGTSVQYFNNQNFTPKTTAVCFEAGQHQSEDSYKNAVSAIINCMRTIGGFRVEDIEIKHDNLLKERSSNLPKLARMVERHPILPDDQFKMEPGFLNFQKISKGTHLATDINGPIYSKFDGLILMPLYQKQGEDGFFLIQQVDISQEMLA